MKVQPVPIFIDGTHVEAPEGSIPISFWQKTLSDHPGKWARLDTYGNTSKAQASASYYRNHYRAYEFRAVGAELQARYVGTIQKPKAQPVEASVASYHPQQLSHVAYTNTLKRLGLKKSGNHDGERQLQLIELLEAGEYRIASLVKAMYGSHSKYHSMLFWHVVKYVADAGVYPLVRVGWARYEYKGNRIGRVGEETRRVAAARRDRIIAEKGEDYYESLRRRGARAAAHRR